MKILIANACQSKIPTPVHVIRADTAISTALAKGLRAKGHDVHYFVTANSSLEVPIIDSKVSALFDMIPIEDFNNKFTLDMRERLTYAFYAKYYAALTKLLQQERFDIVHIHLNYPTFEPALFTDLLEHGLELVVTLHSVPPSTDLSEFFTYINHPRIHYVAISNKQKSAYPFTNSQVVYNGINCDNFGFNEKGGDALDFVGRLREEKGIYESIDVSVRTQRPLSIATVTQDKSNPISKHIESVSKEHPYLVLSENITQQALPKEYGGSKLTLFPIKWEEPFGLVQTESMSCGTPVVAFARGSVPEVIVDGKTGFIVNSSETDIRGDWIIKKTGIDGLCEAVERIYSLSEDDYRTMRHACRKHVEEHFSNESMVDGYEKVYRDILEKKS